MPFVFKGVVLGFLIAAPVGPIGILCISRTLRSGWLAGFASGLGAATADFLYASVAAFGITAVLHALVSVSLPLRVAGAVLLCWMGVRTIRRRNEPRAAHGERSVSVAGAYTSTVLLTILNPATILSFVSVFAVALGNRPTTTGASLIAGGVFVGSALWWLVLASGVALSRRFMSSALERTIDLISGVVLIAFAAVAVITR